jgi:hypothetical protein
MTKIGNFIHFLASGNAYKISTQGENINICWRLDGNYVAAGSKVNMQALSLYHL